MGFLGFDYVISPYLYPNKHTKIIPYFLNVQLRIYDIVYKIALVFGLQEMSAVNLDETGFKAIAGALLDNRNTSITYLDISSKNFFKHHSRHTGNLHSKFKSNTLYKLNTIKAYKVQKNAYIHNNIMTE